MNAINPVIAAALAAVIPPTRYTVTVEFADGTYTNDAYAATAERAVQLAIVDARMASPGMTYCGKVLRSSAVAA